MADNNFRSTLPDRRELLRISPYEGSKRVVQAFREGREEMARRGFPRATIDDVAALLHASTSTYQSAVLHMEAVDTYGISPDLSKQEAIRRMRLVNPVAQRLSRELNAAQDKRGDVEILADGISALLIRAGAELPKLDAGAMAVYLRRDPAKRGATRSALIDLQRWLTILERALDSPLQS